MLKSQEIKIVSVIKKKGLGVQSSNIRNGFDYSVWNIGTNRKEVTGGWIRQNNDDLCHL